MEYCPWYKMMGKRQVRRLEFREDPELPWEMHYFAAPPHRTAQKEHDKEKNPVIIHRRDHPCYPV